MKDSGNSITVIKKISFWYSLLPFIFKTISITLNGLHAFPGGIRFIPLVMKGHWVGAKPSQTPFRFSLYSCFTESSVLSSLNMFWRECCSSSNGPFFMWLSAIFPSSWGENPRSQHNHKPMVDLLCVILWIIQISLLGTGLWCHRANFLTELPVSMQDWSKLRHW